MADVQSGVQVSCLLIKQAVARHFEDVQKSASDDFPYYFDPRQGEVAIEVMSLLKHTRGEFAGKPFGAQPFQKWITYMVFGWRRKSDGMRRFKQAYIETAKKSGKSEWSAAFILVAMLLDQEQGAQCYVAATKRDQAMHVFNAAKIMCKQLREDSKYYRKEIVIRQSRIVFKTLEAFIMPLTSDHNSLDGIDTHIGVVDEYHAHKTSFVSDTVLNSMVARRQPFHLTITTAGFNRYSPCYSSLRSASVSVLAGLKSDDTLFSAIYTLDEGDSWDDETVWIKANPNLGRTTSMENMRMLCLKAKNEGKTKEVDFKTKNLNLWVSSAETWIPHEVVSGLILTDEEKQKIEALKKSGQMRVFGGLDLGQTRDLTAFAKLYDPEQLGFYYFEIDAWCNEDAAQRRAEAGDPYLQFSSGGFLQVTPGNTTDYDYVRDSIYTDWNANLFWAIEYDPHNSTQLVIDLMRDGVEMHKFGQTTLNMNAPTREFEEIAFKGLLRHNGNPLLLWSLDNVELVRDSAGNIKVSKANKEKKVDAVVACIMALGGYMQYRHQRLTRYDDEGVATV